MKLSPDINEYITSLKASNRFKSQIVYHTILKSIKSNYLDVIKPWPEPIKRILKRSNISQLYSHQAQAINYIRSGRHIVVATPTASGKSLIYNLPVIEQIIVNPDSRALYIFPLKALAQDQLRNFDQLVSCLENTKPEINIYDGDTSSWFRKKIRNNPPNIILTNPDMLHLSILQFHEKWAAFLSSIEIVVVDEVHTLRGIMGSHIAQVFRRFLRICNYYGSNPIFIFCSATIANPEQLTEQLTGFKINSITKSGASKGRQHIIFLNPMESPSTVAILLLKAAIYRGLRTIVYCQSRKMTELIAMWAGSHSNDFAKKISAYRAGFLPEERREIEKKMSSGELLAVISTSALELGINIGNLDICILVGYPGTIISTWQRSGRVGRLGQDSALILIAGEDALDQYFMRNPEELINMSPEPAVINPYNTEIIEKHILCAANELPININENLMLNKEYYDCVKKMEEKGLLFKSYKGDEFYSGKKSPHKDINIRGIGEQYTITSTQDKKIKGDIDGFRAFKETHPGALYLHMGQSYIVRDLVIPEKNVLVTPYKTKYYTRVRAEKSTEILEIYSKKQVWGTYIFSGRLRVTEQVNGYEKWAINARKKLSYISLDLPPLIFETDGIWILIPNNIQKKCINNYLHFMGGIHAIEHASIAIFPLLVLSDRNDLGGISIPIHDQTLLATVFIYDAVPGGAGISLQAFKKANELIDYTLNLIKKCNCESGCPSCVHSPKCGAGNRPIDKDCASFILEEIKSNKSLEPELRYLTNDNLNRNKENTSSNSSDNINIINNKENTYSKSLNSNIKIEIASNEKKNIININEDDENLKQAVCKDYHYGVFDIETQRSAQEVGGWAKADRMGISCVVLYDSLKDKYIEFLEDQISNFMNHLTKLELVIGFNIKKFDYKVLSGYSNYNFNKLQTLDILEHVYNRLNYRLSLNHLGHATLGTKKTADGLKAIQWWKQGRIKEIVEYCKIDVKITKDIYSYGKKNGFILFNNKAGNKVRLPVNW